MTDKILVLNEKFACTMGLAVFIGVPGATSDHAHWTHQIAIDMDNNDVECFCDGQWIRSTGVFVPAGHPHRVANGRQINLFFDASVDWIDEVFGGSLDTSCGRVLDRDTLQGIQSCFYEGIDIRMGMEVFAEAFDLRRSSLSNPDTENNWEEVMAQVKLIQQEQGASKDPEYGKLGALFMASIDPS